MSAQQSLDRSQQPGGRLQFSLRTLFIWIAALCGLFTVLAQLPMVWGLMCVWFLVLVAGHVIGNALGTRLRDHGTLGSVPPTVDGDGLPPAPPVELPRRSVTRLQQRTPQSRAMFAIAALGALLGGPLGGQAAAAATGDSITAAGIVVAALSTAVICGLFGWLMVSFLTVVLTSVIEGARADNG